jgi:hypothetical protein
VANGRSERDSVVVYRCAPDDGCASIATRPLSDLEPGVRLPSAPWTASVLLDEKNRRLVLVGRSLTGPLAWLVPI